MDFNVSGSSATVTIGLGNKIFKYSNEIIATVPIQKYYGPKPPPLQYTLSEYEYGIARAFVASAFAIIIALFTARKYLLEKERWEVIRIRRTLREEDTGNAISSSSISCFQPG